MFIGNLVSCDKLEEDCKQCHINPALTLLMGDFVSVRTSCSGQILVCSLVYGFSAVCWCFGAVFLLSPSAAITCACPRLAAQCSGVDPRSFVAPTAAPRLSSSLAALTFPCMDAYGGNEHPVGRDRTKTKALL